MKYVIDIVGTCNLKCPSCGRREGYGHTPAYKGVMDFALFERILDKIAAESPGSNRIVLYNWGEPLMHPRIGEIVEAINGRGMQAQISANGNATKFMAAAIKAKPAVFAISLSGFTTDTYEFTHKGGQLGTVVKSIYQAADYIKRYSPSTQFVVHYHLYKDNGGLSLAMLRKIVKDLDCDYNLAIAQLIALDDHLDALADKGPQIEQKMIFSARERQAMSAATPAPCPQIEEGRIVIYADGSVRLCCNVMGDKYTLFPSFLDVTKEQIYAARAKHSTCATCVNAGFHNDWAVAERSPAFKARVNAHFAGTGVRVVSLGTRNHLALRGLLWRHIQKAARRRMDRLVGGWR